MPPSSPAKGDRITIVGAGVYGLSTALHLASRGYKNVTLFDKRLYSDLITSKSPGKSYGAVRCSPVNEPEYRDLTLTAITAWNAWNEELWGGKTVPQGMSPEDRLFINNGYMALFDGEAASVPANELARVREMEKKGMNLALLVSTDSDHIDSANSRMFNIDPFGRKDCGKPNFGVFDTLGGSALLGKAYEFAMHKARSLGVKVVLNPVAGHVEEILYHEPDVEAAERARGVTTKDAKVHVADFVIWSCAPGVAMPHRPSLGSVAQATKMMETTIAVRIPTGSDLWDRLAPDNFPSWECQLPKHSGTVFGFPRGDDGLMKVGFRATAETNVGGKEEAYKRITDFLTENLPELKIAGGHVEKTPSSASVAREVYQERCVVDHVPGVANLMLVHDWRGYGCHFMLLPIIGSHLVDVMEGVCHTFKSWQWNVGLGEKWSHRSKL